MLTFCPDCMEGWNPVFQKIKHKTYCKLDAEQNKVPPDAFCSRCGSGRKTPLGGIAHQEWCHYSDKPIEVAGRCGGCRSALRESAQNPEIVHHPWCKLYKDPSKPKLFRTDFSEIKIMSVDGLVMRACKIAAEAHREHSRWWSHDPYVWHCMRVAGRVMLLMQATPVEIAAAWLHDVLKPHNDSAGPLMSTEDLADRGMPRQVIDMVVSLTAPSHCLAAGQTMTEDKLEEMDRKWFKSQAPWVKKIKMIDCIDNLAELSWKDKEHMGKYCTKIKKLIVEIGDADTQLRDEAFHIIDYFEKELNQMALAEGGW